MKVRPLARPVALIAAGILAIATTALLTRGAGAQDSRASPSDGYVLHDTHVHLTNYVQEGVDIRDMLEVMGDEVGRAALFGIPLQQQWSYRESGDFAPTYYLESNADLYYYSFTDAFIAMQYLSLPEEERRRFDPMITGMNPADMYAADHVRRVLETFPGVFRGIGEFTVHKEFVSSKIAGDPPALDDPALDRLFEFAGEVGLLVLIHNDVRMPFAKPGERSLHYFERAKELFKRHPETTTIWAHIGLGRIIQPVTGQGDLLEEILADPELAHVHFDISWSETAKYLTASDEALDVTARILNRHPDRFLFGTDEVAPTNQTDYLEVYRTYAPLLERLTPRARQLVLKGNYERLFDEANRRVRAWEAVNVKQRPVEIVSRRVRQR